MNCKYCEDEAEIIIHSNGTTEAVCLEHFYYKFRMLEIDKDTEISILQSKPAITKFME